MGFGARFAVRAELQSLRAGMSTLEVENASYRAATRELTDQLESLQAAVTDLGRRSSLDPASAKALAKLPALMKARAVGGSTDGHAIRAALSSTLASPEDTFGTLKDLLGRLESRLQLVRGDIDRRAALAAATPTIWPAHGWLEGTFGEREDPFTSKTEFHTGLDISTDKGRPVFATAAGKVESASFNGAYGNFLVLNHGFGLTTRYGHLADFTVRAGDTVQRGMVVGHVGMTGRTTGPHLHYEILVNGQLINPLQLLLEPRRP